jgi:hypothetical protein
MVRNVVLASLMGCFAGDGWKRCLPLLVASGLTLSAQNANRLADPAAAQELRAAQPGLVKSPVISGGVTARRILLVDDDASPNNDAAPREGKLSRSDQVFRALVAQAVGNDTSAWEVEVVGTLKSGPSLDRLRGFNLVVWYTGGSYGGASGNTSVLSLDDEKTVRGYLEGGGSVVLISPGYLSVVGYGATWENTRHPFAKEVMGLLGFSGLAKRFGAGAVQSTGGRNYTVEKGGAPETQFTAINPERATPLFTSVLGAPKTAAGAVAVATSHRYGSGTFVYVGFTLENLPDDVRAAAFGEVLQAAGAGGASPAPDIATVDARDLGIIPDETRVSRYSPVANLDPSIAPTRLAMDRSWPGEHTISWTLRLTEYPPDITYEVHRRATAGGWFLLARGLTNRFYTEFALLREPTAYKVVTVFPDGRRGEAVLDYPNPPQPTPLTGFSHTQTAPGTVEVRWDVTRPMSRSKRVFAPGLPADGKAIDGGTVTLTGLPVGIHEVRVVETWGNVISPVSATTRVAVKPDRGRYRVLFTALKLTRQADDDILGADGRGNEIFVGGLWATAERLTRGPAIVGGFARSAIYGDVQNFSGRVQAGTASPQGGLRSGDTAPALTGLAPQLGQPAHNDRFPLVLWEGELVRDGPLIGILPVAFEWSAGDQAAWSTWANSWQTGGRYLEQFGDAIRRFSDSSLAPHPLHGVWEVQDYTKRIGERLETKPWLITFPAKPGQTRPIGLKNLWTSFQPEWAHPQLGFVLTYDSVESFLGTTAAQMLTVPWPDGLSGEFVAYLQLERLSPPPPRLP